MSFRWRDSANGNEQEVMTLDAVQFIRRILQHALAPGFVKIQNFGFLANPCREKAVLLARTLMLSGAPPEMSLTAEQRNAVERRRPVCGVGTLCVLGWSRPDLIIALQPGVNSS